MLLRSDGAVLLQLRDNKPGLTAAGLWVFPGGHADPGEDSLHCAVREFKEETGYECRALEWLLTLKDAFLELPVVVLHVFWELYDGHQQYVCNEGQAVAFVQREAASTLQVPPYLVHVWDLALLAAGMKDVLMDIGSKAAN